MCADQQLVNGTHECDLELDAAVETSCHAEYNRTMDETVGNLCNVS